MEHVHKRHFNIICLIRNILSIPAILLLCSQSVHAAFESCQSTSRIATSAPGKRELLIVDIRNRTDYSRYHIRNSLNLSFYKLKTKAYLKNRNIVLVGYGYDSGRLARKCGELIQSGFRHVWYFQDGILGWTRENVQKEVAAGDKRSIYEIAPEQLLENNAGQFILVTNEERQSAEIRRVFRSVKSLKKAKKEMMENIQSNDHNAVDSNPVTQYYVLDDRLMADVQDLLDLGRRSSNAYVLVLKGGISALDEYLRRNKAILDKKTYTLQEMKGCGK